MSTGDGNADQTYDRENPRRYDAWCRFSWRVVSYLSPGAGNISVSFTNGMITGTVPILAVWFFCMGASIKLSATGTVLA